MVYPHFEFVKLAVKAAQQVIYLAALEFVEIYAHSTGHPFPKKVNIKKIFVKNHCVEIMFEVDGFEKRIPVSEEFCILTDRESIDIHKLSSKLIPVKFGAHTIEISDIIRKPFVKI